MQSVKSILLIFLLVSFQMANAYTPKLIAATGTNGFKLPPVSFLTNISPVINNQGDIAFNVVASGSQDIVSAIFYKSVLEAEVQFQTLLPEGIFASDLSLTDNAIISMGTHDGGSTRGLYQFDVPKKELSIFKEASSQTYALSSFGYAENGNYAYRHIDDKGTRANQRRLVIGSQNLWNIFESELIVDNDDKVSYLFSHELKEDYLIFKLRYGIKGDFAENRPDKLWLYSFKKHAMQIIAADADATGGSSKLKSISNQYSVSSKGQYAFWATNSNSEFVLYSRGELGSEAVLKTGGFVSAVDAFSPGINNKGDILIRGKNKEGINSLFFYSGVNKRWDLVASEKLKIYHGEKTYELTNSRGITFIGKPNLNDAADIVFNALVKELGSGEIVEAIILLKK